MHILKVFIVGIVNESSMFSVLLAFEFKMFVFVKMQEEKDKKIRDLHNELQRERERSAAIQQQLRLILKDLEEHAEIMSIRVEDIVNSLREIELDEL